jgi:hypothetical protein
MKSRSLYSHRSKANGSHLIGQGISAHRDLGSGINRPAIHDEAQAFLGTEECVALERGWDRGWATTGSLDAIDSGGPASWL